MEQVSIHVQTRFVMHRLPAPLTRGWPSFSGLWAIARLSILAEMLPTLAGGICQASQYDGLKMGEADQPSQEATAPDPTAEDAETNAPSDLANVGDPMRRVEAVMFLAREPMSSRKISQLAGLPDGTRARTLVKRLNEYYDRRGRSIYVKQVAGGFQMRTRPSFSMWLQRLNHRPQVVRLTAPAMETLSVVAYRQPVLKAEIEAIRGVSCGELLRQLLDRGLVKIAGRSAELGHPFLYATTRKFLEVFGLPNLDSLPRGDKLRAPGLPDWQQSTHLSEENPQETAENLLDETASNPQNQSLAQSSPDSSARIQHMDDRQEETSSE